MPDELVHKARLTAIDPESGAQVLDTTLPVSLLSNREVLISFEPETIEDQETINLWGGLDHTPASLVRLRPVLIVYGRRTAAGEQGFAVSEGAEHAWKPHLG